MEKVECISFPKEEWKDYKERLKNNKIIYTTRVSKEVNKYSLDKIYNSPFGSLKVVYLEHFKDIKDHPFLKELTKEQIEEIKKYIENGYDVIGLKQI